MYVHQCFSHPCSTASILARVVLLLLSLDGSWLVAMCRDIGTALSLVFLPCTTGPALHYWAGPPRLGVDCKLRACRSRRPLCSRTRQHQQVPNFLQDSTSAGGSQQVPNSLQDSTSAADHNIFPTQLGSTPRWRPTPSSHCLTFPLNLTPVLRPWRGGGSLLDFTLMAVCCYSPLDAFVPGLSAPRRGRVRRTRGICW